MATRKIGPPIEATFREADDWVRFTRFHRAQQTAGGRISSCHWSEIAGVLEVVEIPRPTLRPGQNLSKVWKTRSPLALQGISKDGRKRAGSLEVITFLILDFDGSGHRGLPPDFDGSAFEELGISCVYFTTWSAKPWALTFRLIVPLKMEVVVEGLDLRLWRRWVEEKARWIAGKVGLRFEDIDLSQVENLVQPHFLPAVPVGDDVGRSGWGGLRPHVVVVDDLPFLEPPSWATTRPRPTDPTRRGAVVGRVTWRPFEGDPEAGAAVRLNALTPLPMGLNRVAWHRRHGLGVGEGGRWNALNTLLYAGWRAGLGHEDLARILDAVREAESREGSEVGWMMREQRRALAVFEARDVETEPVARALYAAGVAAVFEDHRPPFLQCCRILARHRELRQPGGGRIRQDHVAAACDVPVRAVAAWLGILGRAGVHSRAGDGRGTTHRILVDASAASSVAVPGVEDAVLFRVGRGGGADEVHAEPVDASAEEPEEALADEPEEDSAEDESTLDVPADWDDGPERRPRRVPPRPPLRHGPRPWWEECGEGEWSEAEP